MILLNGDHMALYAGNDTCIAARGDACSDPAGCGTEGNREWGVVSGGLYDARCSQGFVAYLDIDWGQSSPAVVYDQPYYNNSGPLTGYDPRDWYNLPYGFGPSSLTVQSDIAIILRPSSAGTQTKPCLVIGRSIPDLAPYRYSDGSLVDNRVGSIEVLRNMCPVGCETGWQTAIASVSSQDASGVEAICGAPFACGAPTLQAPADNYTSFSFSRMVTFDWDDLPYASCSYNGFNLRIKTVSNMDSGGTVVKDITVGAGTSWTETFSSSWDKQDLYWSVRAANAADGATWAPARKFQIHPNNPPTISCTAVDVNKNRTYNWPGMPTSNSARWRFECHVNDPDADDYIASVKIDCWGDASRCTFPVAQDLTHGSGDLWTVEWSDLLGQNGISLIANDNHQAQTSTGTGWLIVDQAAPTTSIALNGSSDPTPWPDKWFTQPVAVRCGASDNGTGRAIVGVDRVYYKVDGEPEQVQSGSAADFSVTPDGQHTVTCHAVDRVTNAEKTPYPTANFKIDQTRPNWVPDFQETHGVVSGVWQNFDNAPTFRWTPAVDPLPGSGFRGYHVYFGLDPAGVSSEWTEPCNPCELTPQPYVRTGRNYLRATACDVAGNCTPWTTYFDFRYDGTPPPNPASAAHALGPQVVNDTWQKASSLADFTWPVPVDVGSGVKGHYLYWGADAAGTPGFYTTASEYKSATPLCSADDTCIGYFNIRTVDNVDNQATEVSTLFTLRYDNTPPTADFTIDNGITMTSQTLVYLDITAHDLNLSGTLTGSGVTAMRLSSDGQNWTEWTRYEKETTWAIPAISRKSWPIYLQVRDAVELPSEVISHTIYFDVNRGPIISENFWLFDEAQSSGAGGHASPSFSGQSTLGETISSARINSLNYVIVGGYQAGSAAIPIVRPGYETFSLINSRNASGTGAVTLRSPLYKMSAIVGEIGLPNNAPWTSSAGYRLQPGFLAAAPPPLPPSPTCPPEGCNPPPEPPPGNCEFPQITINNAALFTNTPNVMLSVCAPGAVEMMFSNDGGFPGAQWEPYSETRSWTITTYGQEVLPRFVYAAFKHADSGIDSVYFDDIIYDPNAPTANVMIDTGIPAAAAASAAAVVPLATSADGTLKIYMNGRDNNSGVAEMQVSGDSAFTDAVWEPYQSVKLWTPTGPDGEQSVYVRFRDYAMNVSGTGEADFILDREGPTGSMGLSRHVMGRAAMTTTLVLTATDAVSGVADVRVGADPELDGAIWLPYPSTPVWLADLEGPASVTLYAQFRDWSGNVSPIYSDAYVLDTIPPDVHVSISPGDSLARILTIEAVDVPAGPEMMRISNEPFMIDGVVLPYQDTVEWTFDERQVVWVQVRDSVGNISEPYPASLRQYSKSTLWLPLILR